MKNIVLIGMMGSGKTTIAQILSEKLHIDLIDTDRLIVTDNNMDIPTIFKEFGEKHFRELEKKVIEKVSLLDNHVISTGGGVILDFDNVISLKKNGIIVFIDRNVNNITGALSEEQVLNRPIIKENRDKLYKIYNDRIELYRSSADIIVDNNNQIDDTINEMMKKINARRR